MDDSVAHQHHALVVLGGDALHPMAVKSALSAKYQSVIAADSGWNRAMDAGISPTHLIGDMDSISADDLTTARSSDVVIHEYPAAKDETDAEIALITALREGATRITVLSGNGNRPDHVVALLHSLTSDALQNTTVDGYIGATHLTIATIQRSVDLTAFPGDTISLIPLGGHATVSTRGLQWELSESVLQSHESRGVSNVVVSPPVSLTVHHGKVVAFTTPSSIVSGETK